MAEDHLEPLITECPNCSTRFRVTESQLQIATGKVRCGACLTVFQGIDHLVWESGPGYDSAEQAKQALDELLNELSFDDLTGDKSAAEAPAAGTARTDDRAPTDGAPAADEAPAADIAPAADEAPAADLETQTGADEQSTTTRQLSAVMGSDSAADQTAHLQPPGVPSEIASTEADETTLSHLPSESADDTQPGLAPSELEAWDAQSAQVFVGHEDTIAAEQEEIEEDASEANSPIAAEALTGISPAQVIPGQDFAQTSGNDEPAAAEHINYGATPDSSVPLSVADEAPAADKAPAADREPAADKAPAALDPLGLDQVNDQVSFAPEPRRWWVGIAISLGVVALLAQIFWYQFDSWGRDPTIRPLYGAICRLVACDLPVLRELRAMQTQQLLVRSHPELADALVVDVVIVNDAEFAQPFPVLELRFTTIDGDLVARRGFKPEEYLAGELAGATLMDPKTPVRLALEITDPGGDAVNYFLSFR